MQTEAWKEGTSFGATAVTNTLDFVTHPFSSPTDALTALSMAALIAMVYCAWRVRLSLPSAAYSAVVVALMLIPETVTARPRFLITAFPLLIAAAAWWQRHDDAVAARAATDGPSVTACRGATPAGTWRWSPAGRGSPCSPGIYAVFGAIP